MILRGIDYGQRNQLCFYISIEMTKRQIDAAREVIEMCQIMEDLRAESEARGVAKGKLETAIETAKNLLQMNVGTHEEIAKATHLPIEKVKELAGLIAAQA